MKRDSLASLVHNNLFRSLLTTNHGLRLFMLNPMVFLEISTTIIEDLYANKVDCAKQKNKQKYYAAWFPVLYDCISFHKSYGIYSYLLLSSIKCRATINDTHITIHIFHPSPLRNYSIFLLKL